MGQGFLHNLSHFIPQTTLQVRYYYCHFIDEQIQYKKMRQLTQDHGMA